MHGETTISPARQKSSFFSVRTTATPKALRNRSFWRARKAIAFLRISVAKKLASRLVALSLRRLVI